MHVDTHARSLARTLRHIHIWWNEMFRVKADFEWLTVSVCLLSDRNSHCKNQIEKNERPLKPYGSLCSMGFCVCCVSVCVHRTPTNAYTVSIYFLGVPSAWAASLRLYRITTTYIRLVSTTHHCLWYSFFSPTARCFLQQCVCVCAPLPLHLAPRPAYPKHSFNLK